MMSFFLPLTGKEEKGRLEEKYKDLLDSDDDDQDISLCRTKGKISQWSLDESTAAGKKTSQWLHSPSKKDSSNRINVYRNYESQKIRPRRVLSPKQHVGTKTKSKNTVSTKGSKDCCYYDEGEGSKQQRGHGDRTSHSKDNDKDKGSDDSEDGFSMLSEGRNKKECGKEETERRMESAFERGCEGFSACDTEKPKLSIRPVAAKVDFQLSLDGVEPVVKVPACLNQYLRDYQRDGIKFLYQHYVQEKGAILGDDMGLGKTIQVIGFLSALLGKCGNHKDAARALPKFIRQLSNEEDDSPPRTATKPFLVVAPSAVLCNWLEEFNTWGYFCCGKFHGIGKENCLMDVKKGKLEIVVTTFETFRDNVERLCEVEWEAVIVDEVHKIKGLKAQVSKALGMISTLCRYGLTGTALQNNMIELWSLLDWAQPGILGSPEKFQSKYVHVIEMGQRHDANKRDLALARKQKDKFAEIRKQILLRRTKAIIADQLPTKEDLVVMCRLTDFQVAVYKAILNHPRMTLVLHAEDPCDCGRKKMKASCCYKFSEDGIKTWSLVLSYMHLLLKAANHCALLIPDGNTSKLQLQHVNEVCQEVLKDFPQFVEQTRDAAFLTLSDPKYCGKMKILQGLLSVFSSSRDKVLVFSYSTRLLDIIEHYIISQCYEYRRIDGKTSSQKRMEIVHQFNKDPDIFLCLISTKAGGLGLNLTGANRVVIFDPNWNPSHDLQAQDRAYRIGQTRNVKVYRLISAGTIEENIYLRQIYKQQLDEVAIGTSNAKRYFHGIQGDKWSKGELFGVKNMFMLRTSNICLTMDILKRNEKLEKDLSGYDITRYIPPSLETESVDSQNDNDIGDSDDSMEESRKDTQDDSVLLDAFFGQDRTVDEEMKSSSKSKSPLKHSWNQRDDTAPSTSRQGDQNDSSSDDEEDFFLPKLHSKSPNLKKEREGKKSMGDDMFTVDEITFPKSDCNTIQMQQNAESLDKRKDLKNEKLSSDMSWLLPGGDSDLEVEGKEDGDKTKAGLENRLSKKNFLKHKKTLSSLSWLFPDSDDNDDVSEESDDVLDTSKEAEFKNSTATSKNREERIVKPRGSKPSSGGSKQTKIKSKDMSKQAGTSNTDSVAIDALFEECGVLHVHGNKEVIGSSRAEDHMTRCAIQEVFEMETNSQLPALQCDPLPQSKDSDEEPKNKKRKGKKEPPDHNAPTSTKVGSVKILLGQTPPGVQRQVWGELCKVEGEDQLALAQRLASCSAQERLAVLCCFYKQKHPKLVDTLTTLLRVKSSSDEHDTANDKQTGKQDLKKNEPSKPKGYLKRRIKIGSSSNSKGKHQRPPASTITDQTLLDSESQDSLTAHTPPRDPSLSQDKGTEAFSPVPPKRKKKLSPPGSKSALATRLRQKALNKIARAKLFEKPSERRGVAFSGEDDDLASASCDLVQITDRLDSYVTGEQEDISTLMCEMERKTSVLQGGGFSNMPSFYQNESVSPCKASEDCKTVPPSCSNLCDAETEPYVFAPPSTSYHPTKSSKDKNQSSKRRNYASVLDDIFDVGSESISKEIHLNKKDMATEELSAEKSPSPRKKLKTGTFCNHERPFNPAKNTRLQDDNNIMVVPEDDLSVEVIEDANNSDEVDCLFLGSTLKEDIPRSSTQRKHKSSVRGSRKQKTFPTHSEKEDVVDVDDNSESLFS